MRIILLSGGSGKRLWPLSNEIRSKQFLKLIEGPDGRLESMVQRVMRQIREVGLDASVTIATSESQADSILNQLGKSVNLVTEPERRDTFPAIALAVCNVKSELKCGDDEVIVVMPSDSYTETKYFKTIAKMVEVVESNCADMVLMGINPTSASDKFGYILPNEMIGNKYATVNKFVEKPAVDVAAELIKQGAMWNGGVFAFKLKYINDIVSKYLPTENFKEFRSRYAELPKISFDYEVVEKVKSIGIVPFEGVWNDLGTWNSLSEKMTASTIGNVIVADDCKNNTVINELSLPLLCLGVSDLIVAASPDGILVSNKDSSVGLKAYADKIKARPMYEERRWGTYKVMGQEEFTDGYKALTKVLNLNPGCNISYQYHNNREEIWTFIDGEGLLVLDGEVTKVGRGSVVHIKVGQKHAIRAITDLKIIEVQSGKNLIEEDIIRLDWDWSKVK